MPTYRQKAIDVEAIQLTWPTWAAVCDFVSQDVTNEMGPEGTYVDRETGLSTTDPMGDLGLFLPTRQGLLLAREGDWIIRGLEGELRPCSPEEFARTYDLVSA